MSGRLSFRERLLMPGAVDRPLIGKLLTPVRAVLQLCRRIYHKVVRRMARDVVEQLMQEAGENPSLGENWNARYSALQLRLLEVEKAVGILKLVDEHLDEQTDLLKSSLEVSPAMIEDFRQWKQEHPLPPEPLVSVCVATYNRSQLLVERSIASILAQSYSNWEAIIVGDCCTDDTAERMSKIRDPRIRFVNLPERGRYPEEPWRRWCVAGSQAMNHGLALAKGDLITHLDDDDEFLPQRLEILVALAKEHNHDFIWHPFYLELETGEWQLLVSDKLKRGFVTTSSIMYRSWFRAIPWTTEAHWLLEPGDWNRIRRIKYMNASIGYHSTPLLRHFRENTQKGPASG